MSECERFSGYERDICEGRAKLSLEKTNRYREKWGLPPLAEKSKEAPRVVPRVLSHAGEAVSYAMGSPSRPAGQVATGRVVSSPQRPRSSGPGTEATLLLRSLGVTGKADKVLKSLPRRGCCQSCTEYAQQMDRWGVEGCRQRFEEIVEHFRESAALFNWRDTAGAVRLSITTGLVWSVAMRKLKGLAHLFCGDAEPDLTSLDPLVIIVAESIRRAEEKARGSVIPRAVVATPVPEQAAMENRLPQPSDRIVLTPGDRLRNLCRLYGLPLGAAHSCEALFRGMAHDARDPGELAQQLVDCLARSGVTLQLPAAMVLLRKAMSK